MNGLYDSGREAFLGALNWLTADVRVVLLSSAYVVDKINHDNLDDIAAGARVQVSSALTGKTATDGVADADDYQFTSLSAAVTQGVIYNHTGTESTSTLVWYFDTAEGLTLPAGSSPLLQWSNGPNKIFKL